VDVSTTSAQHSLWLDAVPAEGYPSLRNDVEADVAVIGGGITGLTTALLLKRAGLQVAVVEAARIGSGVSGNNTAKVTALQSTMYSTITGRHGRAAAADYAAASVAGVDTVAKLIAEEHIDCGAQRRTAATYAISTDERQKVEQEAEAAAAAGLPVTQAEDLAVPFPVFGAVRLADQLLIHPARYLLGLAAAVQGNGSSVFENSRVLHVHEGHPCRVRTENGTVIADRVVVATHYPILDRGVYFARLEAIRAYCVAVRLRSGTPPADLAISVGSPAWSLSSSDDLLIVCGASHPAGERGITEERFHRLDSFARAHWDVAQVTHRWSAQDPRPYDDLPMIGSYTPGSKRLFVATGYAKWGLSTATFGAMILADLLTDKANPWANRFSPHRATLSATPSLVRMNAKVARDLVGDRLVPVDGGTTKDIPAGEARVVQDGLGRKGVYRDEGGGLHGVSVRCTHLGCLVRFNQAERSWDCPCHGSRFDVDGNVLEGPATKPLPSRDPEDA